MSTLLYNGFDTEGRRVRGAKVFASEQQMSDYLHKCGVTNFQIFESKTIYKDRMYSLVAPNELSIFCKQMSVLFFSHITLMEGIVVMSEQTENNQLKITLNEVYSHMEKGYSFAESMSMYTHIFSSYMLNMIVIGESSGTLDEVFSRMSVYFDKESKVRKKIKSAIAYPAVLTALMTAIVIFLIVRILPMFGDILSSMGAQLPSSTAIILNAGTFLASYALFIIGFIVIIVISIIMFIRSDRGRLWYDRMKFKIPAYRYINSRIVTARFSHSMSILLKSGVQLLNALEDITALMDNSYLEEKMKKAIDDVKNGQDLSVVLSEIGVFPSLFLKMFVIGQKTGNLDDMLDKSASVFDEEVDDAIERFTVMLEPILIIILSVIVGVILLSVMLPMITIMNTIG